MGPTKRSRQLGRMIQQAREARGLSLRAVSKDVPKTDAAYLLRLERGEYPQPSPQVLQGLSRVLEIPLADLYALADYTEATDLPAFAPYLRAKTDLPDEAISELQNYYQMLERKFGVGTRQKGGRDDERAD
jgi:transcriptional regulator with XRE-family HTH domain